MCIFILHPINTINIYYERMIYLIKKRSHYRVIKRKNAPKEDYCLYKKMLNSPYMLFLIGIFAGILTCKYLINDK